MKRIVITMFIVICCVMAHLMPANADNNKPINVTELPAKAQTVLSQYFNNQKIAFVTVESGIVGKNYDVVLQNGTKIEFDKKGNVTEIDCKQGCVPEQLIPSSISTYLKKNQPGQTVKKFESNRNEYEVELSNEIDITFNKHFQVIDID